MDVFVVKLYLPETNYIQGVYSSQESAEMAAQEALDTACGSVFGELLYVSKPWGSAYCCALKHEILAVIQREPLRD